MESDAGPLPVDAGGDDDAGDATDAGTSSDAGPTDAGPTDAGPTDAGPTDAGPTDAGPTDADGGPPVEGGTCDAPTDILATPGTFETSGFLVGASEFSSSCRSTGPETTFAFELTDPGYAFVVMGGNSTVSPVPALVTGTCDGAVRCAGGALGRYGGFGTAALAPGRYQVVADSGSGSSGTYSLVVSRSPTLGGDCGELRELTLEGTRGLVAGSVDGLLATHGGSCGNFPTPTHDQLFRFVAPRDGALRLDLLQVLSGSAGELTVSVMSGPSCDEAVEIEGACAAVRGDSGDRVELTADVVAGTTYIIRVGAYFSTGGGAFTLEANLP